nr:DsbA family protein [Pseudogulbenkiania sp. MAI-1]
MQEAADGVGLRFNFDAIDVLPNTLAAHRLVQYLGRRCGGQQQLALIEALYDGYFMQGENIGDTTYLARLAARFGLPHAETADCLLPPAAPDSAVFLRQGQQAAQAYGIGGVPGFAFNRRYALSGAVPAARLLRAMQQAMAA